jgi:hypothetical protein
MYSSTRNMNANPKSTHNAILEVYESGSGSPAIVLATPSGIITPSAAPMSSPVLKVDNFAKLLLVIDDDNGTRPAPKDAAPMTRDIDTMCRRPPDAIPLARSISVQLVYVFAKRARESTLGE